MSDTAPDWITLREIAAQPRIWRELADLLPDFALETRAWIAARRPSEIWLTGAGTSAYLGEVIAEAPRPRGGPPLRALASTDLVARPRAHFDAGTRPLVVSFGRSGNSPESLGVLDLLDRHAPAADRLHVTCNPAGALARRPCPGPGEGRVLVLPESTHDQGFAMTASFSAMLFSGLAAMAETPPGGIAAALLDAAESAEALLAAPLSDLGLAERPERVVFLGSGPLRPAARECALKVLELTAGRVPTLWDTPLGFRHGPKSFVTPGTRIVVLRSADRIASAYEADLLEELREQFGREAVLGLGADHPLLAPLRLSAEDAWNAPVLVLPAQRAAAAWADGLGLDVDDPFRGRGTLSRVVSGVRLHTALGW